MDIPCIYLMDIHGISKDIPCISRLMDIHGISKDLPCISMDIVEVYIYMVYIRHIPGIYRKSGFQMVRLSSWADITACCAANLKQVESQTFRLGRHNSLLCWRTRLARALRCPRSESAKDVKAARCFAELQHRGPLRAQLERKQAINRFDIIPPWLVRRIACSAQSLQLQTVQINSSQL
jgi:hypothetical protein